MEWINLWNSFSIWSLVPFELDMFWNGWCCGNGPFCPNPGAADPRDINPGGGVLWPKILGAIFAENQSIF